MGWNDVLTITPIRKMRKRNVVLLGFLCGLFLVGIVVVSIVIYDKVHTRSDKGLTSADARLQLTTHVASTTRQPPATYSSTTEQPPATCSSTTVQPPTTGVPREFPGIDCYDLLDRGINTSGIQTVYPYGNTTKMRVYCDQTLESGGWMVFQRRVDDNVDFYRKWTDYKYGFGDLCTNFWLGNEFLYLVSNKKEYTLRVDMEDFQNVKAYAEYNVFRVASLTQSYRLRVGGYSGNAGNALKRANGHDFSTKDRDHTPTNCTGKHRGGWWYDNCHAANLNGLYLAGAHESYADGINWLHFRGYSYSLKEVSMKIRPAL